MAWLLATNRILGRHPELAHQESFAQALRERGLTVDNSRISRWESGTRALPPRVVTAYEEALGLPAGTLAAVAMAVCRAPGAKQPPATTADQRALLSQSDLDALFGRAESGTATGADWLRLATELGCYERIYLSPSTWQRLSTTLLNELTRSVGAAWVRRQEASQVLLGHAAARRHLFRAIGEVVTHPWAQVVDPALHLFRDVDDPSAGGLLLRLIEHDSPMLRRTAAGIVPGKLARGHYGADAHPQLEQVAALGLRGPWKNGRGLHAVDLAITLPDASLRRLLRTLRDPAQVERVERARATGLLVTAETARNTTRAVTTPVQEATAGAVIADTDRMLMSLTQDALFHAHRDRRAQAATLLAASPYADALADRCLDLVGSSPEFVAGRLMSLVQRVGLGSKRGQAIELAAASTQLPTTRMHALVGLGLARNPLEAHEARQVMTVAETDPHDALRQSALFALGMNAPHEAQRLTEHTDPVISQRASWWQEHGSALHDTDDVAPDPTPIAEPGWIPAPRQR
ncbi:helix-turn-helix domain-containing protein [Nocardioides daejeonensis]|uniref:helix-turn-helix domain-containing protein n=1 Tax=Nocardioides daejeonensis TaxID=1046556 RepID=UPI000D742CB1|nr:helix-turn-helix transcriptional regulator [Nocardioides daejeonensis]